MNITLMTKPNRLAVAFVAGVIPKRSTLPILGQVRLAGNETEATITGTDLDQTCAAILETEGARTNEPCLLPGQRLTDLFRSGDKVTIDSNCKVAQVTHDGAAFTMHQMPAEEWPVTTEFKPDGGTFEVMPDALITALHQVEDAVSVDAARYILRSVFFTVKDSTLTMVATDGRRLHLATLKAEGKAEFILSSDALVHLHRLLKAQPKDTPVIIETSETKVRITGARLLLISKVVAGNYPNYKQVIPTERKEHITLDVPQWLNALRTVEKFTSEKCSSVKVTLTRNLATLTTKNPDLGSGKATIALNYKGNDFTIAFLPYYLIAALTPLKDCKTPVTLDFRDDESSFVISTTTTTTVIMPMRMS